MIVIGAAGDKQRREEPLFVAAISGLDQGLHPLADRVLLDLSQVISNETHYLSKVAVDFHRAPEDGLRFIVPQSHRRRRFVARLPIRLYGGSDWSSADA